MRSHRHDISLSSASVCVVDRKAWFCAKRQKVEGVLALKISQGLSPMQRKR